MGRTVTIFLNDALYNAGILGFYRLYIDRESEFDFYENRIQFDSDLLDSFTDRYLKRLQDQFQDETIYGQVTKLYDETLKQGDNHEDAVKSCIDRIKKLEGSSYKSGYEIIKKRGCSYDFLLGIKEMAKTKELELRKVILDEFVINMKEHKDIFILKGIAYTKVNMYWENVSFFQRDAVQTEFKDSVGKYFTEPAVSFTPAEGKKATANCCQCGTGLSKKDSKAMSWLVDIGIDVARKTSPFWNYNVDVCICPVCALIYSCMPLGFTILRDEGIFINAGSNPKELDSINGKAMLIKAGQQDEAAARNVLYIAMSKLIDKYQQLSNANTLQNIQVVRKNAGGYTFDVVSSEILKRVSRCSKELKFVAGNWLNGDIYSMTISRILRGRNLYNFINELLHYSISNNRRLYYIYQLVLIQALVYLDERKFKGGEGQMSSDEIAKITRGKICGAKKEGEKLNKAMSGDDKNDKKIRGLSFKLLNHLKTRDTHGFADTILRQYMGLEKSVPTFISESFNDESVFLDCGYAFVAGLQGAAPNESVN